MPAFEVRFKRLEFRGRWKWDAMFEFVPPNPSNADILLEALGVTDMPAAVDMKLCTIDLTQSRCEGKCEPRPVDMTSTTSWQMSVIANYVCEAPIIARQQVGDAIHLTYELRVWRAIRGINPLSGSAAVVIHGIVTPGSASAALGQLPDLSKRVIVEVHCVDIDDIPAVAEGHGHEPVEEQPPAEAGEPVIVDDEIDEDCGIWCRARVT